MVSLINNISQEWAPSILSSLPQSYFSGYVGMILNINPALVFTKYYATNTITFVSNSGDYTYSLASDYAQYNGPSRPLNIKYTISIYLPQPTAYTMNFLIYVNSSPVGGTLILENDGNSNITTGSLNVIQTINSGDRISLYYKSDITFNTCNFSINISGV